MFIFDCKRGRSITREEKQKKQNRETTTTDEKRQMILETEAQKYKDKNQCFY